MRRALSVVAFVLLTLATMPCRAQLAAEWHYCDSKHFGTPDERIRNCTRLIESPEESQHNRSRAYLFRGNAWSDKKNDDRARADYDQAIRLDPSFFAPSHDRGLLWANMKYYARAIADFTESIRLDPKPSLG